MAISDLHIPTLETERLILRAHRESDFENMLAAWQDPAVVLHLHGQPMSREDAWGRFLKNFGMWALRGHGLWAVEEKASGAYAGTLGTFVVKRDMIPRVDDMPEAGWTLASQFHGQGYATEAMQAGLAWTDEKLSNPAMFCIVAETNYASLRVAEKCGFRPWHQTVYEGAITLVLKRPPRGQG
jgi:RimJ/RimL family protein N-acetyltransferase